MDGVLVEIRRGYLGVRWLGIDAVFRYADAEHSRSVWRDGVIWTTRSATYSSTTLEIY